ncbi:MAG: NAD(P)-dependent oxidoreductase, partial [Enhydrobacter sp.]
MPHIVVADPIHPGGIERLLKAPGVTLDHPGETTNAELKDRLSNADGLIVRGTKVNEALLVNAKKLRVVCRHGVGYDLVDVPALTRRGIALMITPEANAASVAEHALMLMLSLARNVVPVSAAVRRGEWRVQGQSGTFELGGRSVLVIGFGRIGTRVSRLCTAFGMHVMVHDPYMPAGTIRGAGYEAIVERDAGLAKADFVTVHI